MNNKHKKSAQFLNAFPKSVLKLREREHVCHKFNHHRIVTDEKKTKKKTLKKHYNNEAHV